MKRANLRACFLLLLLSGGAFVSLSGCQPLARSDSGAERGARAAPAPSEPGSAARKLFYPTGERATSTLLLERTYPEEVLGGREFQFALRVENLTRNTLTDVVLTEHAPSSLKLVRSEPTFVEEGEGMTRWRFETLAPGASQSIKIVGTAARTGALLSQATVSCNAPLPVAAEGLPPQIAVHIEPLPDALLGESFPVQVSITNNQGGPARKVQVEYTVPDGLSLETGETVWRAGFPALEPGTMLAFPPVKVTARRPGKFTHLASVKAAAPIGEISAASPPVAMSVLEPGLEVSAREPADPPVVGRPGTYALTVKNAGNGKARGVEYSFRLPPGVSLFEKPGDDGVLYADAVVWKLGDLDPGASRTVTAKVVGDEAGVRKAAFSARDAGPKPGVHKEVDIDVRGVPGINVKVVIGDENKPISVSAKKEFYIAVKNTGTAAVTGLRVACRFDDHWQYDKDTGLVPARKDSGVLIFELPKLDPDPNRSTPFNVRLTAVKPGDGSFDVEVNYQELRGPPARGHSVHSITRIFP